MALKKWLSKGEIRTGHKSFDRYCSAILHGNSIGDGFAGAFIRPFWELKCNNLDWAPGELQYSDLRPFFESDLLSRYEADRIREFCQKEQRLLYAVWYRRTRNGPRIRLGLLLTTAETRKVDPDEKELWRWTDFKCPKAKQVIDYVAKVLTTGIEQ